MGEKNVSDIQDFAVWLTGCGYDFTQHEYYMQHLHLLTDPVEPSVPVSELEKLIDKFIPDNSPHSLQSGIWALMDKAKGGE